MTDNYKKDNNINDLNYIQGANPTISQSNSERVEEIGSVQEITHKLFGLFLADRGISSGAIKISSVDLYHQFLAYISENQYSVRPSNRAFGRAATKNLPHCKRNTGTHYLVNK